MPEENLYQNRIKLAKNFYESKRKSQLDYWNKLWKGKYFDSSIPENDRVFTNYVYSTIKNKLSALYYQNPKILVESKKELPPIVGPDGQPQDARNEEHVEMTLNYQFKEYNFKKEIKKSLLDWKRSGYGAMFTGWDSDMVFGTKVEKGKTFKKEDNSQSFKLSPSYDKEVEDQNDITLLKDQPDFRRINPNDIFFSPDSLDDDDIPYVVLQRILPYDDVKNDKRYKNTKDLPEYTFLDEDVTRGVGEVDDAKRVKIYDYFDKDKWCVLAEGSDKPLLEKKNPYTEVFGDDDFLPVVLIFGDDDLEEFYPLCEIDMYADLQNELNKIRAQQINHRKRFNRKYIYDKTRITQEDVQKLKTAQDGALIGVASDGAPLSGFIEPIADASLTYPEQLEPRIIEDFNVISGVLQYQRGAGGGEFETLGQTQIAENHAMSRRDEEQEQVEEFTTKIYRRLFQLDQKWLQIPIYNKIVGDDGNIEWLMSTSEDIQGEYDINVESGSMVKLDDDVITKQTLDAFNLLYGRPEAMPIHRDLIISVLESLPATKSLAEKFKSAPPLPPPEPEGPKLSMSFSMDKMWPMLSEPERQQLLAQYGIELQAGNPILSGAESPIGNVSIQGGGPLSPDLLAQGNPSEAAILGGVNQVR